MGRSLAVAVLGAMVLLLAGCGHKHPPAPSSPTARRLALEGEDLTAVAAALAHAAPSTLREVEAAKAVWPLISAGLPPRPGPALQAKVEEALRRTQQIKFPPLFQEGKADILTGPGSSLAGLFRGFVTLSEKSWNLILAAIRQDEYGPSPARKFTRENVNLYIESIYDAHFELAQIGKGLEDGYMKLGGPNEFHGGALTQSQVQALAQVYSEPNMRLYPHVTATLGS